MPTSSKQHIFSNNFTVLYKNNVKTCIGYKDSSWGLMRWQICKLNSNWRIKKPTTGQSFISLKGSILLRQSSFFHLLMRSLRYALVVNISLHTALTSFQVAYFQSAPLPNTNKHTKRAVMIQRTNLGFSTVLNKALRGCPCVFPP